MAENTKEICNDVFVDIDGWSLVALYLMFCLQQQYWVRWARRTPTPVFFCSKGLAEELGSPFTVFFYR